MSQQMGVSGELPDSRHGCGAVTGNSARRSTRLAQADNVTNEARKAFLLCLDQVPQRTGRLAFWTRFSCSAGEEWSEIR